MAIVPHSSVLAISEDLTPSIGTEFESNIQLSSLLEHDDAVAELAKLTSHRGVLFFKSQDITLSQQKALMTRLGIFGCRPAGSGLHIHPLSEDLPELGNDTTVISSAGGISRAGFINNARASSRWHSDVSFEPYPSDYSILKMHTLPTVGGDTLWASAYDRLSPGYQSFLSGLTAEHDGNFFHQMAERDNIPIRNSRGHVNNSGEDFRAVHPVIRTHPLTGYRTLFVNKSYTARILELSPAESEATLDFLTRHVAENHDLQVRYRWGLNDVALWDNRCTYHSATYDYGSALRVGYRVVGIGERPFFDPNSRGRAETELLL